MRIRQAIAVLALVVGVSYLTWRALFTMNADALVLSWFLWILEAHAIVGVGLATFSLWDRRRVEPATDELPGGRTAVLITTYNEPAEIVLPTVAAAAALEGDAEVWLLDDGVRDEMRELADRLGVNYLGREDSTHAKAGNLNNALARIDTEFVAVLDADHVPHRTFLRARCRTSTILGSRSSRRRRTSTTRTRSSTSTRRVVVVVAGRCLHRAVTLLPRDPAGQEPVGCGVLVRHPAVLRTAALRDVGGVATDSVTEDLMTTIRLHRRGWRTVFHDEVLARGLAAPTAEEYNLQRRRWGIGAMQTLRHERPLTRVALSWQQRLSYAATFLAWFESLRLIGLLAIPPLVLLTGAAPIDVPLVEFAGWFVAYFTLQFVAMKALGGASSDRSAAPSSTSYASRPASTPSSWVGRGRTSTSR
jgi:cellulose synthase (UDP-forming)